MVRRLSQGVPYAGPRTTGVPRDRSRSGSTAGAGAGSQRRVAPPQATLATYHRPRPAGWSGSEEGAPLRLRA